MIVFVTPPDLLANVDRIPDLTGDGPLVVDVAEPDADGFVSVTLEGVDEPRPFHVDAELMVARPDPEQDTTGQ